MSAVQLRLLVIRSVNLENCAALFRRLGMQFTEEKHGNGPLHLSAQIGEVTFEIYPATKEVDVDRLTRLGFTVHDLRSTIDALKADGTEIVEQLRDGEWGLRAVVRDADGRSIELYQ
jgi:catechol 2,3-dioxygenase-like lactoylglutathione lyase family enzyme